MQGTSGQNFGGSSASADLQQCLESRLRARLAAFGSPEYVLTWKHWPMQLGPPICALRASARPTSDSAYGGWVTPSARDWKDTPGMSITGKNPDGSTRVRLDQLPRQAAIAGYPTPIAGDSKGSANYGNGRMKLPGAAKLIGQTPSGHHAQTAKLGALNPELSRWLMGYPDAWSC